MSTVEKAKEMNMLNVIMGFSFFIMNFSQFVFSAETEVAKLSTRNDITRLERVPASTLHELVFMVNQRNLEELNRALMSVSDPNLSSYGRHWTRQEVADLTVISGAAEAVVAYLTTNGVTSALSSPYSDYVTAVAPISVWEALLDADFYSYSRVDSEGVLIESVIRTESYSLPTSLVAFTSGALNTVQFPPRVVRRITKKQQSSEQKDSNASPDIYYSYTAPALSDSVTPALLNEVYNILSNTGNTLASQAVYESDNQTYSPSDLSYFQTYFGLPQQPVSVDIGSHNHDATCNDPSTAGNCGEANLDVQYMMAVSQVTPMTYYYSADWMYGFVTQLMAMSNPPLVVSISYGSYESETSRSVLTQFDIIAQQLGLLGVTLVASSGDDGVGKFWFFI